MVQLLELTFVQDALLTTFVVVLLTAALAFLFSKYGAEDKETERQRKRRLARQDREHREAKALERRKAAADEKERRRQQRKKSKLQKLGVTANGSKEKAVHKNPLFRTAVKGHTARVVHFAVPHNASFVVSASEDGTTRVTCESQSRSSVAVFYCRHD